MITEFENIFSSRVFLNDPEITDTDQAAIDALNAQISIDESILDMLSQKLADLPVLSTKG